MKLIGILLLFLFHTDIVCICFFNAVPFSKQQGPDFVSLPFFPSSEEGFLMLESLFNQFPNCIHGLIKGITKHTIFTRIQDEVPHANSMGGKNPTSSYI